MNIQIQTKFPEIKNIDHLFKKIAIWVCKDLNFKIKSLAIIFINDEEIKKLHKIFLGEPISTDVITFNLGENEDIEGETYISLETAKRQAKTYHVNLNNEISRLIIHSCLHLAGYDDHDNENRKIMKKKEDKYVELIQNIFLNKVL